MQNFGTLNFTLFLKLQICSFVPVAIKLQLLNKSKLKLLIYKYGNYNEDNNLCCVVGPCADKSYASNTGKPKAKILYMITQLIW